MDSPLALYRRYRPETFAEVIGQEHVTEPLRAALANNRVNHAYLFSGPRGCGKTTSARILARALNCELAPVADPCGRCDSCVDLARNGPGSIDVIEIDAASHGGVDDARDLREKAFFAPVRSRYKVYIIDEAHMVSSQGFNALLKLVEEPPPHLRFIFATTEPEKVIATIRSRTHHYPFRLIPPRLLSSYLSELCEKEGVQIEPAALPLVVRAGAGSARDTMSVLDQLLGGAGADGVTYKLASGLLGYTPDTLLDEVVDAFAAGDGSAVFGVVDKVIETGQDPRRFTEDLLRRLRDLVIVAAVPDAPATGLIDVSADQADRLVAQASRFGRSDLSRAADLVATGLTEMRGATAPRLLLELICARVLLPGADHTTHGVLARLDRIERRASIAPPAESAPTGGGPAAARAAAAPRSPEPEPPTPFAAPDPEPAPAAPAVPAMEPQRIPAPEPVAPEREEPEPVPEPPVTAQPVAVFPEPGRDEPPVPARRTRADARRSRGAGTGRRRDRPCGRCAVVGRRTTALARRHRGHQAAAPDHLDPPHPERPGRRGRRHQPDPRLRQRGRAGLLRRRRQRRDRPAGRHRRHRHGLAGRDHRRPGRPARRPAAARRRPRPLRHGSRLRPASPTPPRARRSTVRRPGPPTNRPPRRRHPPLLRPGRPRGPTSRSRPRPRRRPPTRSPSPPRARPSGTPARPTSRSRTGVRSSWLPRTPTPALTTSTPTPSTSAPTRCSPASSVPR